MRMRNILLVGGLVLTNVVAGFAQANAGAERARILRNADVLAMVKRGIAPNEIIKRIRTSQCGFDTFPPVQRDLRRRGVPASVIEAMALAPYGPASVVTNYYRPSNTVPLTMPVGTAVEVENAFSVSSASLEKGNPITFLVTRPVYVNGNLGIARNAVAIGRVIDIKKAQGFGRPGELTWEMENVFAVDGTKVPLRVSGSIRGTTRVPVMLAGAAATAALVFPYTSPAALVWAFKKGDDAILFGSRRFTATVGEEAHIASPVRRQHGITLFSAEAISRSRNPTTMEPGRGNWSFRPSGSFLPGGSFLPSGSFLPGSFSPTP
jgi:hypothetical protein